MNAKQSEMDAIFPGEAPRGKAQDVALLEIRDSGKKAPGSLIAKMRRVGLFEPVVLADYGDDGYVVIDGERRVAAAREIGLESIPSVVYDGDEVHDYIPLIRVMLNEERGRNDVSNYDSVVTLYEKGHSVAAIAQATGLTTPTVKRYLRLTAIPDALLDLWKVGKIKTSVLHLISGMSEPDRESVRNQFASGCDSRMLRESYPHYFRPEGVASSLPTAWVAHVRHTLDKFLEDSPTPALAQVVADALNNLKAQEQTL